MSEMADARPPAHLEEHFENLRVQNDARTLGMWVFLVTEVMFFGGLFMTYTTYRETYFQRLRARQPRTRREVSIWAE